MKESNQRIGSFDALRIILSLFVILLHFNNSNGGNALKYTENNMIGHEFLLVCESLAICAVNTFMILSGYFLYKKQMRRIIKPILLILTVMGYNSFFTLIKMISVGQFSLGIYIWSLIPINYFAWLYSVVYLLSPWINIMIKNVTKKHMQVLLILMLILFSVYPSIVDIYCGISGTVINGISTVSSTDSGSGYTLVNFIMMYCIGAYIQKYKCMIGHKKSMLGFVFCSICTFFLIHYTFNAIYYNNIAVVLSSVFLVLLFCEIKIKENIIVLTLSGLTFQVFVIHCCMYEIWEKKMGIKSILSGNIAAVIGGSFLAVIVMYGFSVGVALVGRFISKPATYVLGKFVKGYYNIQTEREEK